MLAQNYSPIIGGEERHVQDLSVELSKRGHEVAVATLHTPGAAEFELDHGVRIYRVKSTMQRTPGLYSRPERSHAPPFPDPEVMLALRQIIAREQPQIVHAHNWILHSGLCSATFDALRYAVQRTQPYEMSPLCLRSLWDAERECNYSNSSIVPAGRTSGG
jgi:glycosyltransferase involved in cell wall biosynthesis